MDTNSQECAYIWEGGLQITPLKLYGPNNIVTAWASRPNVSRRCFERLFSVSSRSRHHTSRLQPCY